MNRADGWLFAVWAFGKYLHFSVDLQMVYRDHDPVYGALVLQVDKADWPRRHSDLWRREGFIYEEDLWEYGNCLILYWRNHQRWKWKSGLRRIQKEKYQATLWRYRLWKIWSKSLFLSDHSFGGKLSTGARRVISLIVGYCCFSILMIYALSQRERAVFTDFIRIVEHSNIF